MEIDIISVSILFVSMVIVGFILGWAIKADSVNKRVPKKWPYLVLLRVKRGNGWYPIFDRARALKDKETGLITFFELKKQRENIKPINFEFIQHADKEGLGGFIDIFMPSRNEYIVTKFVPDTAEVKVLSDDNRRWAVMAIRRAFENYGQHSKWQVYLPFMAMAVAMIITIIVVFYGYQSITDITKAGINAVSNSDGNEIMRNISTSLQIIARNTTQVSWATGG